MTKSEMDSSKECGRATLASAQHDLSTCSAPWLAATIALFSQNRSLAVAVRLEHRHDSAILTFKRPDDNTWRGATGTCQHFRHARLNGKSDAELHELRNVGSG